MATNISCFIKLAIFHQLVPGVLPQGYEIYTTLGGTAEARGSQSMEIENLVRLSRMAEEPEENSWGRGLKAMGSKQNRNRVGLSTRMGKLVKIVAKISWREGDGERE